MLLLPVSHLSLQLSLQMVVAPVSWLRAGQLGRQMLQWHRHALSKVWLLRNLSHILEVGAQGNMAPWTRLRAHGRKQQLP